MQTGRRRMYEKKGRNNCQGGLKRAGCRRMYEKRGWNNCQSGLKQAGCRRMYEKKGRNSCQGGLSKLVAGVCTRRRAGIIVGAAGSKQELPRQP